MIHVEQHSNCLLGFLAFSNSAGLFLCAKKFPIPKSTRLSDNGTGVAGNHFRQATKLSKIPPRGSGSMNSPAPDAEHPRSPLRPAAAAAATEDAGAAADPSPPPPHNTPLNPSSSSAMTLAAALSSWSAPEATAAGKANPNGGGGGAGGSTWERGVAGRIVRRERRAVAARRAAVWIWAAAAALCLISMSLMAADRNKGWAVDSYDRYLEYRYCISINVLGFLYAGFQTYAEIHRAMKGKSIIGHPFAEYFNFFMDQILAYLLVSASSAATARTDDWVSHWGADPFPSMARGSTAVSYLAFIAFALSSVVSAYNLFSRSI